MLQPALILTIIGSLATNTDGLRYTQSFTSTVHVPKKMRADVNNPFKVPNASDYTTFLDMMAKSEPTMQFRSTSMNEHVALGADETPEEPKPPMWVIVNSPMNLCYQGKDFINMAWCVYTRSCMNMMQVPEVEKKLWYVEKAGSAPDCLSLGYNALKLWDLWYPGNVWAYANDKTVEWLSEKDEILSQKKVPTAFKGNATLKVESYYAAACMEWLNSGARVSECKPHEKATL